MFNITSRYPGLIAAAFIIISLAVSLYFYKNISITGLKRYLLITLKTLAIFLLLVLFLEPALLALVNTSPEKVNVVLIDGSRSITLPSEDNSPRSRQIRDIPFSKLFGNGHNYYFELANNTIKKMGSESIDSIDFSGYETNASAGFKTVKDLLPDAAFNSVVLISDGLFNTGGNPLYNARELRCPVITIGIGDTIQRKDILLRNLIYNDRMFTGADNEIKAEIQSYGLQNDNVNVNLLKDGNIVSTKSINIRSENELDEILFTVNETNPGIVKYRIAIDERPGEITYKNNYEDFLVTFIDSKINILYISDGPGYDNSLISSILHRINNFKVALRTAKSPNEFYEGSMNDIAWGELSAIFLLGYPSTQTNNELLNSIAGKIKEYNIPLLFFAGKNTDYKKLDAFGDLIPFSVQRSGSESLFNPQLVSDPQNTYKDISAELLSTPQIFINQSGITQKPGSSALMTNKTTGEPVLITRSTGKNNSTAFLGYGIWRWRLNPKSDYEKLVENFLLETVNLTLQKEKKTKFKVYPDKNIFDYTEKASLTAEVYDENYLLTGNASVRADLLQNGKKVMENIELSPSDNKYHTTLTQLPSGDYTIEASAYLNNDLYGKDVSRFLVDTINTEFKVTRSSYENLKELSLNTGGQFFPAGKDYSGLETMLDTLKNQLAPETGMSVQKRIEFRENKYVLILIIVLLGIEWALRKRNNLP